MNWVKHIFFSFLGIMALPSCGSTPEKISNLNHNQITAVGHGGPGIQNMFAFTPHNTMAGYRNALANKELNGVEMDVQLSADNKLVLFHDIQLNNQTNGKGKVAEHTYAELISYHYALDFFNFKSGPYPIAGLEEVLTEVKKCRPGGTFVLDLKLFPANDPKTFPDETSYQNNFAAELVNVINRTNTRANVCIESTNLDFLQKIYDIDSTLHLFYYSSDPVTGIQIVAERKFYGLTIKYTKISKKDIEFAHNAGVRVSLWGPRTRSANIKCIHMQPDYIQTDKVNYLVKKLRKYRNHE